MRTEYDCLWSRYWRNIKRMKADIMIERQDSALKQFMFKKRFLFLLILLLGMLVVAPFIEDYGGFRFVIDMVVTAIFIATMYAISSKKHHVIFGLFLVVPTIATMWLDYFMIVNYILQEKEVTAEIIYAAVVVYFLMAMLWSNFYQLLETLSPGSFSMPEGQLQNDRLLFLYFSLVTITTLGYGDMTPLTDRAAGLASVEALSGQIYLVVLVAWLVGMHVSKKSK